jgi:ATP phosphoribosyltransferase
MLTMAIPKGRIWRETKLLLSGLGLSPRDGGDPRSAVLETENPSVRLLIVRAQDAPTYVACGAAQIGVAGRDVLAEREIGGLYYPLDLRLAKCRLVAAVKGDFDYAQAARRGARFSVATKYINLARAHFANKGVHADFIKLHGAMELAPLVGLADVVVDLADSGATLRAHGLREAEKILEVSAHLIINRAAIKTAKFGAALEELRSRFAAAVAG